MPVPAGVAFAAPYVAGAVGQWWQNRSNSKEAARNRQFQSSEARKMRDFQERMRNTEWQAAVADMEAAGVNPAVAYSKGGAASPAGAMGSGSQAAPMGNTVSSAMQVKMASSQLKLVEAQVLKAQAEARAADMDADVTTARRHWLLNVEGEGNNAPARDLWGAELAKAIAEASRAGSMSQIAGVGGEVAGVFSNFMPALRRIGGVSAGGLDSLAGVTELAERVARMRDDVVLKYFGMPKRALLSILRKVGR